MARADILIVEDELITTADLEDALLRFGYHVTGTASSGKEAIRRVEQTRPDLVLMDIKLKGTLDGIEAACEIRRCFDIPVIYLTAHADDKTLARAKLAEPLGYIVKPFQDAELHAVIEMAVHKSEVDRQTRNREDALSATLDALGEGVIALDRLRQVTYLNSAAEQWTGWTLSEARGRDLAEIFPLVTQRDRRPLESPAQAALQEGILEDLPQSTALIARNGVERRISGATAPMRDDHGHISGAVISFGGLAPTSETAVDSLPSTRKGSVAADNEIVLRSETMKDLMKFAARVASSGVSCILLQGESGTGKDVIARALHQGSRRSEKPFVSINCAAIPDTLVESELFGYEKGAFTDARSQKRGVLELAHSGTIFLDEIGELQFHLQTKLLRVLEEQAFRRLGGVKDVNVDIRVIAATNKNLAEAVRRGEFREDLFYRLNVIQIRIPPLREHREDILPLAEHFVRLYNRKFDRNIEGLTPEAESTLAGHDWPGNVRELRNTIERAMVFEEGPRLGIANLTVESGLSTREGGGVAVAGENSKLEEVEKSMLRQALEQAGGNQSAAARRLGISRDTLRYRIKKFNL